MALDPSPHGSVFISSSTPSGGEPLGHHGWVGRIRAGGVLLWRGSTLLKRSSAYKQMVKANRENKYEATLVKPIPDDAE